MYLFLFVCICDNIWIALFTCNNLSGGITNLRPLDVSVHLFYILSSKWESEWALLARYVYTYMNLL